jgi:hypothetical protein
MRDTKGSSRSGEKAGEPAWAFWGGRVGGVVPGDPGINARGYYCGERPVNGPGAVG